MIGRLVMMLAAALFASACLQIIRAWWQARVRSRRLAEVYSRLDAEPGELAASPDPSRAAPVTAVTTPRPRRPTRMGLPVARPVVIARARTDEDDDVWVGKS